MTKNDYTPEQLKEIADALKEPFDPATIRELRGMSYLNAAQVTERLNNVLGPFGWSKTSEKVESTIEVIDGAEYVIFAAYRCHLTVLGETKTGEGEARRVKKTEDGKYDLSSEVLKSADSDAFKRAATYFGIGLNINLEGHYEKCRKDAAKKGGNYNYQKPAPKTNDTAVGNKYAEVVPKATATTATEPVPAAKQFATPEQLKLVQSLEIRCNGLGQKEAARAEYLLTTYKTDDYTKLSKVSISGYIGYLKEEIERQHAKRAKNEGASV